MRFDRASRLTVLILLAGGMTLLAACNKKPAPPPEAKKEDQPAQRFVISKDEQTVTDTSTRLVWKRCVEGRKYLMKACLGDSRLIDPDSVEPFVAQEVLPAGWRLPTSDELFTIIESRPTGPDMKMEYYIDEDAFPPPLVEDGLYYWTGNSRGGASGTVLGWYLYEGSLLSHGFTTTKPAHVRLVKRAN